MYLRESKPKRADGREIVYLQLAENVWDPAKGRSQARIIYNCGRADDAQVVERLRRLAKSILRRCAPDEIVADAPEWRWCARGRMATFMRSKRCEGGSASTRSCVRRRASGASV